MNLLCLVVFILLFLVFLIVAEPSFIRIQVCFPADECRPEHKVNAGKQQFAGTAMCQGKLCRADTSQRINDPGGVLRRAHRSGLTSLYL